MRRGAWLLLLAAALALAGCTRIAYMNAALAYRNAQSLLAWTVDDYVDLAREQRAWLDARLADNLAWHRANELPRYRRFLLVAGEHLLARPAEQEVAALYDEVQAHYVRTVEHLIPDIAEFLLRLDAPQIAQMEKRFAEANRKLVKEAAHGTPEERRADAVKRTIGHLEQWTGRLTREQRALVARRRAAFPDMLEDRLADRRYRQAQFVALARSRERPGVASGLHRLLVDTEAWRRPVYRDKLAQAQQLTFRMLAELAATLTPAQRAHLRERVDDYAEDMARLIAAG